ncbi:HAMP domain-containing sensor histidine kinase [Hyphomicrobium sp.]|uniref:sensor histidine kinase n=1 Tax=Hyphomicrobium sp. TaxID=82 RepID=UPI0025B8A668|nr:HAMP domain-containing sensor histidine kinase [Hyphomicrobium sp.]MCC7251922.1 cache domain-containing protein [Hyphomicrobium sp.]
MTDIGTETRERGLSVRFRLLAIALLPTLVVMPLLLGIAVYRWNANFDATLISKVSGDLTIAHQYLARILEDTGKQAAAFGASTRLRDAVEAGAPLDGLLDETRVALDFDFLYLIDDRLNPVVSARPFKRSPRADWPIIASALANKPLTSIDIFNNEDLAAFGPELATRARVELVPTPNAVATDRTEETRGMVVHSATPVTLAGGRSGALVGGILLNANLKFIDTINDLVYREASLPKGSQGTVTIFLDDVRIATNVRLFKGQRANGTRVSAAVRLAVLDQGNTWLDSAFVVNDWYISAYEPIVGSSGRRIGMLYVGFLEAPFVKARRETLLIVVSAFLGVAALSVPIFLRWAGAIFRPIERMMGTIAKVETGDLSARTGAAAARDEIGRVAAQLDHLLDLLQERDRQLRGWNEDLNTRVAERTHDLEVANRQLEATTKQLVMSEKLAVIGEITAGVAHEINNPIAVMQGNLEVVRALMENNADPAHVEFRLLDEQIHRISQIVTKLLQFARPEEYAGYIERLAPDDVIVDSLPLIRHLLKNDNIDIIHQAGAQRMVLMNRTELQQVLVNLMVNAIHAMPEGGRLFLKTRDEDRNGGAGIVMEVRDTGVGMSEGVKARIFDPFFTTKRRNGTGLGLSISHKLVTRQGGMFDVESAPGKGTTFTVWLPETT